MVKILLVGGGSGGPAAPLIAVAQEIRKSHAKCSFLLVGTKHGPERIMAKDNGIEFATLPAGKFRRYFSWQNFISPFLILAGFIKSFYILRAFRPQCILATGSYVQVPMIWAAWLMRIPSVIHQQDYLPSLANVLCQAAATHITVTFSDSQKKFYSGGGMIYRKIENKISVTGNPFRENFKNMGKNEALAFFKLRNDLPVILILGGGTGSNFLNQLILSALPQLTKTAQIIHSTGKNKNSDLKPDNYNPFEFISNMAAAYAAADLVICRAGLSTITELSNLEKISIIIPLPRSHQELNALFLASKHAAVVVTQDQLNSEKLMTLIKKLMFDHATQVEIKQNIKKIMPHTAAKKIAELVIKIAER